MGSVTYNSQSLYVGPSGENFCNYIGNELLNKCGENKEGCIDESQPDWEKGVHNLVSEIERLQSFSYDLQIPKQKLKQINTSKILDRPIIQSASANFSFEYLVSSISNEFNMGLCVNFPYLNKNDVEPFLTRNGESFLNGGNFNRSILSNFQKGDPIQTQEEDSYVLNDLYPYKDKKNYYLAVRNDKKDIDQEERFLNLDSEKEYLRDEQASDYNVIAFGNCYMTSYSTSASIGQLPSVSASFVSDNVIYDTKGIDFISPSINPKDGTPLLDKNQNFLKVDLPSGIKQNRLPALNPGDIVFKPQFLDETSKLRETISGVGVGFEDIYLNSYSIKMDIPRKIEHSLGYKIPLNREIDSTSSVSLSINGTISGMGNSRDTLEELMRLNQNYDFTISLKGPKCEELSIFDSMYEITKFKYESLNKNLPIINYFFKSAKLESFSSEVSISNNLNFQASFSTEIDPDDLSKGFFISGFLSDERYRDFALYEDGSFISLEEEDGYIITNETPIY